MILFPGKWLITNCPRFLIKESHRFLPLKTTKKWTSLLKHEHCANNTKNRKRSKIPNTTVYFYQSIKCLFLSVYFPVYAWCIQRELALKNLFDVLTSLPRIRTIHLPAIEIMIIGKRDSITGDRSFIKAREIS